MMCSALFKLCEEGGFSLGGQVGWRGQVGFLSVVPCLI